VAKYNANKVERNVPVPATAIDFDMDAKLAKGVRFGVDWKLRVLLLNCLAEWGRLYLSGCCED